MRDALEAHGSVVTDLDADTSDPVDYPNVAAAVARAVTSGATQRGVVVCGSGVGASVAANKVHGVRAGLCHDTYPAHQGVEHDDMNVLVLGGQVIGESRHLRRLRKVQTLDDQRRCVSWRFTLRTSPSSPRATSTMGRKPRPRSNRQRPACRKPWLTPRVQ